MELGWCMKFMVALILGCAGDTRKAGYLEWPGRFQWRGFSV